MLLILGTICLKDGNFSAELEEERRTSVGVLPPIYQPKWTSFLSTKEVSSYLHSVFGTQDTQPNPYSSVETGVGKNLATGRIANLLHKDVETKEDFTRHQASIQAPIFTEQENTATPFRDESLPLVEANDYLVCHKCNTSYADKDAYLQHLLTSHQSKNKSRLCTSISDGVIIKDGKYECQFCHKIFLEKHRYNGHVGNMDSIPQAFGDPKEEMNGEAPRSILVVESVTEALNAKNSL
ncbi:uncharacterized protein LOC113350838 [Papaver somniferum]|uniref:uncharacterized protein LOC113350838 n=1 Tax=Papaver somniferum TaxID=3469 RepID=UPI000E704AB7|nr:uncharacterized protein LOC113350838 [Papaver somniferum]